jgi:hypothetical protein
VTNKWEWKGVREKGKDVKVENIKGKEWRGRVSSEGGKK